MSDSKRKERTEKMLNIIEERLNSYTVEDTIDRLHSYKGSGPTIREFFEDLNTKKEDK